MNPFSPFFWTFYFLVVVVLLLYYIVRSLKRNFQSNSKIHSRDFILSLQSKEKQENNNCLIHISNKSNEPTNNISNGHSKHPKQPVIAKKQISKTRVKQLPKNEESQQNIPPTEKKNWEFPEDSFTNKLIIYPNEHYCIKETFKMVKRIIEEKLPISTLANKTTTAKINEENKNKQKKNLKLLFLKIHKKKQEEKENQELNEILINVQSYSDLIKALNQFSSMKTENIVIYEKNYLAFISFFIKAKMKKWVSLFLKETNAQNIKISNEILDKALYLFSNIDDFEIQIDNFIIENQKNYIIANYYYRIYMIQYCQMMRQNYISWKYYNLIAKKKVMPKNEKKDFRSPMMKKLSPHALEFSPVQTY